MTPAAFHEAGHVLGGFHRGLPIAKASIVPTGSTLGVAVLERRWGDFEPRDLLLMVCCGPAAEAKHTGRPARYDENDREAAYELAAVAADAEPGSRAAAEMLRRCEAHARALVTLEWKRITKVAAALVRHEELSGEQLQDLMWVKKE